MLPILTDVDCSAYVLKVCTHITIKYFKCCLKIHLSVRQLYILKLFKLRTFIQPYILVYCFSLRRREIEIRLDIFTVSQWQRNSFSFYFVSNVLQPLCAVNFIKQLSRICWSVFSGFKCHCWDIVMYVISRKYDHTY